MGEAVLVSVLTGAVRAGTPLLLAGLGELVNQRSGVLNLNIEGLMLVGALTGVIVHAQTDSVLIACACAVLLGMILMLAQAWICIWLNANQVATGLAFVLICQGLTAYVGSGWVGRRVVADTVPDLGPLPSIPFLGPILFRQDCFVYFALLMVPLVWAFLYHTRWGLVVRACGEDPKAAEAVGVPVRRVRLIAGLFAGSMAAVAGVQLSLSYASQWQEGMVAGRGWIALVLVMFALWRPQHLVWAAVLFGGLTALHLNLQAMGIQWPPYLMGMLPFVVTLAVMPVVTSLIQRRQADVPVSLGRPYVPSREN